MDARSRSAQWRAVVKYVGFFTFGGLLFAGLPEAARYWHGGAFAEGEKIIPIGQNSIPPGMSGNFNFNQQGGTNYQTYINQLPPKLSLTAQVEQELLANLPKDKPITIIATGSLSDLQVGVQIGISLQQMGIKLLLSLWRACLCPHQSAR
jgi:hypothetical protein